MKIGEFKWFAGSYVTLFLMCILIYIGISMIYYANNIEGVEACKKIDPKGRTIVKYYGWYITIVSSMGFIINLINLFNIF